MATPSKVSFCLSFCLFLRGERSRLKYNAPLLLTVLFCDLYQAERFKRQMQYFILSWNRPFATNDTLQMRRKQI